MKTSFKEPKVPIKKLMKVYRSLPPELQREVDRIIRRHTEACQKMEASEGEKLLVLREAIEMVAKSLQEPPRTERQPVDERRTYHQYGGRGKVVE